jgi:hypothetical protein
MRLCPADSEPSYAPFSRPRAPRTRQTSSCQRAHIRARQRASVATSPLAGSVVLWRCSNWRLRKIGPSPRKPQNQSLTFRKVPQTFDLFVTEFAELARSRIAGASPECITRSARARNLQRQRKNSPFRGGSGNYFSRPKSRLPGPMRSLQIRHYEFAGELIRGAMSGLTPSIRRWAAAGV